MRKRMKKYFTDFFLARAAKQAQDYFKVWAAVVSVEHIRLLEYKRVMKFVEVQRRFNKALTDDKNRQNTCVLTDGFKSLNQN